ncbi:MAG: bifunctional phosphoribosyl-AMP cyclohydrolase/phosphoribosyl-ATP diphosphatase HisIE [bacterium]|nr:bifunctional phosphoribosyl-AMP cyclohydrolase/phosphoribosyl-ATP diphosphatase HisIE [bacterium]
MNIDFNKRLIPAIIQNDITGEVLMLGYMNKIALDKTIETGQVWFYSRSKERLWMKGEVSGNVLDVVTINPDCDQDAILIKVKPAGSVCHTGNMSCFGNSTANIIDELFQLLLNRKVELPIGSYTASLFNAGTEEICAKVIEESSEVTMAALQESKKRVIEEVTDVIYHLLVLLVQRDVSWQQILKELASRKNNEGKDNQAKKYNN